MRRVPGAAVPAAVYVAVLLVAPLGVLAWISLHAGDGQGGVSAGFTGANYARVFAGPVYVAAMWGTLRVSLAVMALTLVAGYPIALFIARSGSRGAPFVVAVVAMPLFVSVVVRSFGWIVLLGRVGPVSQVLEVLGVTSGPVRLLGTEGAVLVGLVHILLPLMILPIAAVLRGVDRQLDEAALSLGASPLRVFLTVVAPLSLPGVAAGCLLVLAHAIAAFVLPELIGSDRVKLMATMIYQQVMVAGDVPFGAALALVMVAATFGLLAVARVAAGRAGA